MLSFANTIKSVPREGKFALQRRGMAWTRVRQYPKSKPSITQLEDKQESDELALNRQINQMKVNELVQIGRHTNITAAGKVFSFSALVIMGNGNGKAGLGYGKGSTTSQATKKATKNALRNQIPIWRYQDKTFPFGAVSNYRATRAIVTPNFGKGLRASNLLTSLAKAFGVTDVTIKTIGSRNNHKRLRAVIKAFTSYDSPEIASKKMGKKFLNLNMHLYRPDLREFMEPPRSGDQEYEIDLNKLHPSPVEDDLDTSAANPLDASEKETFDELNDEVESELQEWYQDSNVPKQDAVETLIKDQRRKTLLKAISKLEGASSLTDFSEYLEQTDSLEQQMDALEREQQFDQEAEERQAEQEGEEGEEEGEEGEEKVDPLEEIAFRKD